MSYVDKKTGKKFPRITFIVGLPDCPYPAIIEARNKKGKRIANITSAIGTLIHSIIENIILNEMELPEVPYDPKPSDKHFLIQEKIRVNKGMPDRFKLKEAKCLPAFHDFWNTYKEIAELTPIFVEKRVGTGKYGMGTVDLISTMKLKGRVFVLNSIRWFEECECKEDCNCKFHTTITIIDWKSASRKQKSYKTQGAAYIFNALDSGVINDKLYPINNKSWCLLLGGTMKNPDDPKGDKLNYNLVKGSYQEGISDFFKALKIYKDPEATLKKDQYGSKSIFSKCVICGYMLDCPNRSVQEFTESEVTFNNEERNV